ncbi:error-prone DNA polymerase [Rhodoferax sp.]|jgi:error-prone DNA polymerase|uniref:error-prone DNA polymerase n=1 Tax=Rhodoferax sp. TaxID=50421 RepID=UPI0037842316
MVAPAPLPDYAELHCLSSFSFQRGASQPHELVQRAHRLGYRALALTDACSVSGVVRAHTEAQRLGLQFIPGAEFFVTLPSGHCKLVVLPHNLPGWGNLCEFITLARRAAPKGQYRVDWHTAQWGLLQHCEVLLALPPTLTMEAAVALCLRAKALWGQGLWLAITLGLGAADALQRHRLQQISALCGVPLVAAGNVHMHARSRKPLHDVLTSVRLGKPIAQCGVALKANAELHLRTRTRLAALYPTAWLAATLVVAQRCSFSLDELRYQYPREALLPGLSPAQTLRHHTLEGAQERFPGGLPHSVQAQIEHELSLIAEMRYEMYFLTVHDIVRFARSQGILCQGRGSAANSAVCYCLGVTEVDPARTNLLFERFISRERDEPPDIDVDFEHQRREEVIQYIYQKYGRERAAITAVITSYRPRSALRDVGRALHIPEPLITALAKEHPGMYSRTVLAERLQNAIDKVTSTRAPGEPQESPAEPAGIHLPPPRHLQLWIDLATQLQGFPRHLSQHVGGFVLTHGPLSRLVPIENASMPERSVIQWDKDDLDDVGLLKVDVLALGMLSAIRRCLQLVGATRGRTVRMQDIPSDDTATFDMVCRADTVGVFQIESRAQMSMLPRLKPRCFYDLVVEVAIVRPGPIQGGMVHPYLKAREHPEHVQYASPALKEVLKRTLGVPIFQEQVMQIAMAAADFSAGEADQLRRSMAAWKRKGGVHVFYERLVGGMRKNGYTEEFAEALFKQIEGFGEYGFPESHAASFALLVYVSCWLKCHEPACFLAALLNSQPMGFYGPSQLVQDAQRHGVQVRAVDVSHSDWDCTLEPPTVLHQATVDRQPKPSSGQSQPAVRLGLRLVSGLSEAVAQRIAAARAVAPFANTQDLALRCALDAGDLKALASADALLSLSGHRRQQVWDASALRPAPPLLRGVPVLEAPLELPQAHEGEEVVLDYAATGLSLRSHPVAMLRAQLVPQRLLSAAQLRDLPSGRLVRACGIVTMRQQPATAKGVVFVTLEDETGSVNVIVWKAVKDQFRDALYRARLMAVYGVWQRDDHSGGEVRHLVAKRLVDRSDWLGALPTSSRDFH